MALSSETAPLACGSWRAVCLNSEARPQNLHGKMGGTKPTHSVYAVRELVWGVPTSNCLEGGMTWGVPSVFGWERAS